MLPWHSYPYPGAGSAEGGGGAEDLQTDVMRFMAMLGLCLVAIFALVQSLPVTPVAKEAPTQPPAAAAPVVHPAQVPQAPPTAAPPASQASPPTPPLSVESHRPPAPVPQVAPPETIERQIEAPAAPVTTRVVRAMPPAPPRAPITDPERAPAPTPPALEEAPPKAIEAPPPPVEPPPANRTPVFTLRFVDAQALLALVQRDAISLFAVDRQGTSRLSAAHGRYAFDTASAPAQMHDMDPASVPVQVRSAYTRSRGRSASTVRRWGVVLPASTRRSIDQLLRDPRGGELQIGADGRVRLVPGGAAQPVAAYLSTTLAEGVS